jgi:hypothetical protein
MSATLYALIVWQGASGLAFQPGYSSKEECQAVYQGPHVICWQYDPSIKTWTAFFRTSEGPVTPKGFGAVWRFPNESACRDYINALKPEAFGACRQLPHPEPCPVSCRAAEPAPPPPATEPEPKKLNPAALEPMPDEKIRTASEEPPPETAAVDSPSGNIQLADGHYEPGFKWIEDLPKTATATKEADKPVLTPRIDRITAPKPPAQTRQSPGPFRSLMDVVMLPFDFLRYRSAEVVIDECLTGHQRAGTTRQISSPQ